jgi:hypothetical protein
LLLCSQTKGLRFFIRGLFVFSAQINEEFALFPTLIADLNDQLITGAVMRRAPVVLVKEPVTYTHGLNPFLKAK